MQLGTIGGLGALILAPPNWLHRWWAEWEPDHSIAWDSEQAHCGLPQCRYNDKDKPRGIHFPHKLRNWVLDGFYIDIFFLFETQG